MKFNFYGLILGISFYLGYLYLKRQNIPPKLIDPLFGGLIIFGIIGARIYHVLDYWPYYQSNPLQIFNLPAGGLGIIGALIGGTIFTFYFSSKHQLSFSWLLNLIAPFLPLAQSIGRWGNFANQEVYSPTGQPVWLYESIALLGLFLLIRKLKYRFSPLGLYLLGFGLTRFVLDFLRNDLFTISNIKISQLFSILCIIIGLWILSKSKHPPS